MTLYGYYFTATGVTEYAFFHGDQALLRVMHIPVPNTPVRVYTASGAEYTFGQPSSWDDSLSDNVMPSPGASFPFIGADGAEAGRLYLLREDHFAVAVPGAALTGRVIQSRTRRSICFTGMDDALVATLEYGFERMPSRERFGEWFPRRYVAEVMQEADETLLALALAVPFLGFEGIDVG